jgi:hypothetical protein
MRLVANVHRLNATASPRGGTVVRFAPPADRDGGDREGAAGAPTPTEREALLKEDLPYKIEIWDDAAAAVEQVVAVTANASIGYAAYYAATREFPDRQITLRHRNSVVARWTGSKH